VDDLEESLAWYEAISFELANRFRQQVDARFTLIEQRPESFGRVDNSVRATRVPGFPYLVLFESFPECVRILGVVHASADPEKWRRRKE
jgi:hypothetical protein